jgi:hypothetical protein
MQIQIQKATTTTMRGKRSRGTIDHRQLEKQQHRCGLQ